MIRHMLLGAGPWRRSRTSRQEDAHDIRSRGQIDRSVSGNLFTGHAPNAETLRQLDPTSVCSSNICGAKGIRTPGLFHAMEARYQLRHSPVSRDSLNLPESRAARKPWVREVVSLGCCRWRVWGFLPRSPASR